MEKQRLVRLTILTHRIPAISEEEFHHHWSVPHPPLVGEWMTRHGLVKYTQVHTPSWMREQARASPLFSKSNLAEADGICEALMPSLQCWENAIEDPYYRDVVAKDEEKFSDHSKPRTIFVGWEECYIKDGKVVEREDPSRPNYITA